MGQPLRVLILEDSEDDTALVVRALHRAGYEPVWRRVDGTEAMQAALDEAPWDVVLADYTMPSFGAAAGLEVLAARGLDVPFIIVSGSIGEETAVQAMKAGAHDYVMKDNLARLIPAIERERREAASRRERRRAEEEAARLGRILDEAPVEIYIFEAESLRFTQVNRTAQRNRGYTMADLVRLRPMDLLPELDEARIRALLDRLRGGELERTVFEASSRRRDGSSYPVEVRLELSRAETPPAFVAIVQDVSARRQAEEERARRVAEQAARGEAEAAERRSAFLAEAGALLAGSLDYYTTLASVARLVVPVLADWCVIEMLEEDGSIRRMPLVHAKPAQTELASALDRAFPPDLSATTGLAQVLETKTPVLLSEVADAQLEGVARSAEQLRLLRAQAPVSAMVVPLVVRGEVIGSITLISSTSGRHYGAADLALAEDLARRAALAVENARLYRRAQEADRRKDEFLAMLGHELRNPLGAISAAIEVLDTRSASDDPDTQQRAIIGRQARQLSRLVDDLLDVARVTSGKITLQRQPVDLCTVARRSLEALRTAIEVQKHEVALSTAADSVTVDGDGVRLEQVVINLIDNAIKYTPPGGHIHVSVATVAGEGVIRVGDTGIGIAAEALPSIFGLFAQAPESQASAPGGLGLGLALVRTLVELHGGRVSAHSEGNGQGSEFVVRLPLARAIAEPAPEVRREARGRARRVLVVDDNADGREALRALLEVWGHEVEVAEDGEQGIELALARPPDVGLIDIGLPGIDGYELARKVRAARGGAGVYLVALTGYGRAEDRRLALEAGFDAHLVKPIDPGHLSRLLAES
jgi:PAS domain S-box-containing protein